MANRRRPDVKKILADPDLRRKLMVTTIQATQAREGIETTIEQADRAYYVISEGERAAFFDLARFGGSQGQPDRRHEIFIRALQGQLKDVRFNVPRCDFSAIDGAPLAYGRIGLVAHIFKEAPALERNWAVTAVGLQTSDDSRFVRCWWELLSKSGGMHHGWVPFAKGGQFSRFYADVHLLVLWGDSGEEICHFERAYIRNEQHYFKPGLTWPRAASVFNVRILPEGCIFADKGPAIFPNIESDLWSLLGILNSNMALYFGKTLTSRETMGGRWEVGVVRRFPIPYLKESHREHLEASAKAIHDAKAAWDCGNEISTHFTSPWLLNKAFVMIDTPLSHRLDQLSDFEATEDALIQKLYAEMNEEVYRLYGIPDSTRKIIEGTLGERPSEIIWPQMEGKSPEQKRMEHVWRLLSSAVKRIMEEDDDGIVPYIALSGESSLLERVYKQLEMLFPDQSISQVEVQIVNELKSKVKGYRSTQSIQEWLNDVFFEYHASLYKNRPICWHIASTQGKAPAAFGALIHYHEFDRNRMAKLRASHLRDAIEFFRREGALAAQEKRESDRLDWQAKLEEAQELDRRLQLVQEGYHEGPLGGDRDFRILTPWKVLKERPNGWEPDLDDGVKVNIEPLQRAGVLRMAKVV
jgi:hypothetical protein